MHIDQKVEVGNYIYTTRDNKGQLETKIMVVTKVEERKNGIITALDLCGKSINYFRNEIEFATSDQIAYYCYLLSIKLRPHRRTFASPVNKGIIYSVLLTDGSWFIGTLINDFNHDLMDVNSFQSIYSDEIYNIDNLNVDGIQVIEDVEKLLNMGGCLY